MHISSTDVETFSEKAGIFVEKLYNHELLCEKKLLFIVNLFLSGCRDEKREVE